MLKKITKKLLICIILPVSFFLISFTSIKAQTTPVYGNVAVVTAAYQFKTPYPIGGGPSITSITYCDQAMIKKTRFSSDTNGSELWTLINPPAGSCQVVATFNNTVKEKSFTSTVLKNIDTNSINATGGMINYFYKDYYQSYYKANSIGDNIQICSIATHPEGGRNLVTPMSPKIIASKTGNLLYHAVGLSIRRASSTAANIGLGWNTTLGTPFSGVCTRFNLNPASALAQSVVDTVPVATPIPPVSTPIPNQGINVKFYDNKDLTNLKGSQVYVTPELSTVSVPSGSNLTDSQNYSTRWDGYFKTTYAGTYTFKIEYDDAVRLWIDDQLIFSKWSDYLTIAGVPLVSTSSPITLQASTQYKIKVEHYNNAGNAYLRITPQNLDYMLSPRLPLNNAYTTVLTGPSSPPIPSTSPVPSLTPIPTPVIPSTPPIPSLTPSPTPTATPKPAGLSGKYYNNKDFTSFVKTRVDSQLNFNTWGTGIPITGVSNNTFSVRWNGFFKAPVSGNYTFYTQSDDGVRLFVNGVRIINNWTNHLSTENTSSMVTNLVAGQYYRIQLDYYDDTSNALIQLKWSYPGRTKQIIPASALFH